jgi:hypothetical protein
MLELMLEAFVDALVDSAKMLPLLFAIYVLIEVIENRFSSRMDRAIARAGAAGPALGALAGSIPQCGFSVMGTALFNQRLITIGTLLAIYLSTSDEAIPIMLSDPGAASKVVPLILTKVVIAVVFGYLVDAVFHRANRAVLEHSRAFGEGTDDVTHEHVFSEVACCGHEVGDASEDHPRRMGVRELLVHPLKHTLKIFVFIFIVSFLINVLLAFVGEEAIGALLAAHPVLQPFFAALVGLIPNCAASVAITEFYLKGLISFGAVIAGLSASGGLGILVLLKDGKSMRKSIGIIVLLFTISVISGFLVGVLGIA